MTSGNDRLDAWASHPISRYATTKLAEKHMACESVGPVTCSGCGSLFDRQAWVLLVLVERIDPTEVRRMLLHWPEELCIEVRRCGGCAQQIAAKRHAPAEHELPS